MSDWHPIAVPDDLSDPGTCGVSLALPERTVDIILLRTSGSLLAYLNRCPHTGVNLEWQPNRFLDLTGHYLQCATHGALFRLKDGVCVRGPCVGQHLSSVPLRIESGKWWVQI
ncbi:MAG: Rieske 2Fe-2S domain-containing protein [Candidatus Thiodiazotropha sp. (ex Monitilora ramsayi)]|nr:Rieske 2Fe-2S domain-containing protein [Candidatus Thiodiazotropha sp. (ex Monitilora ramsayi)]